ncbi:SRPBCC family protein [Hyalangium minutum]|uniref:Polyketide cyclase n=1 Tax=Hyalangium minutum TaxID=394096 RepID=A0A085W8N2_9BACT|nr:SRPBCC family protein [Hyalangium minutum]KFE64045.1 hypothetical protein DB31_2458 [Hyalangium minutum]
MIQKILLGLAVAVVALAGFISTRPAAFSVQRSATIQAPAAIPFAMVNDFHRWAVWSPWEKLDPAMTRTFTGADTGLDAMYEWDGKEVGAGRMTILESKPAEQIRIRLEFLRPFEAQNTTTFTFTPEGSGVTVSWRMEGRNGFIVKAFSLFVNMDQAIGKDFEAGLANLKAAAETEAKKRAEEKALAEKVATDAAVAPPALPEAPPASTATAPAP